MMFDPRGKLVEWLYVHFFEPESPPDEDWAIDETVSCFNRFGASIPPLRKRTLVVPEEVGGRDGFPWNATPERRG